MLLFWSLLCFCFEDVILFACWMWRWRTRCSPPGIQVLRRCMYVNCSYPFLLLVWLHPSRVYRGGQCCMSQQHAPLGQSRAFLSAFAALRKATISFTVVFSSAWNNLAATDGFSWNLIFEGCSKICRESLGFIKIWQEWRLLYTKTVYEVYNS